MKADVSEDLALHGLGIGAGGGDRGADDIHAQYKYYAYVEPQHLATGYEIV